jgi:hypothetical protein
MPALLLILFKINLVLLLFAAAYHLILRRLTFYTINRVFLVLGIVFSTIYPFINLTDFFNRQEQVNPNVTALVPKIDMNALMQNNAIIDYWNVIVILFYVGVVCMALRLIALFVSLYRVHQTSKPGSVRNLSVRILDGHVSPFSFWQTVYVNPEIHSTHELDTILEHEQIHVKEWHTLDIILAEISVVFYWFNPGVWLMKKAIKENIEFITDARIVKKGIDKKAYQYSLLGVGSLQPSVALVNNFNLSDLKKRIKMMNAKRSSPKKLVIYALILPVLLITTLAFTISKKEIKEHLMPLRAVFSNTVIVAAPIKAKTINKLPAKKSNAKKRKAIKLNVHFYSDSSENLTLILRTLGVNRDSLHIRTIDLPPLFKEMSGDVNAAVTSTMFRITKAVKGGVLTNADTVAAKVRVMRIENIKFGYRTPASDASSQADDKLKEVVIRGYGRVAMPLDSIKNRDKVDYFLNGKKIDTEELKKVLNPEDIKNIAVKNNSLHTEVLILAKKANP